MNSSSGADSIVKTFQDRFPNAVFVPIHGEPEPIPSNPLSHEQYADEAEIEEYTEYLQNALTLIDEGLAALVGSEQDKLPVKIDAMRRGLDIISRYALYSIEYQKSVADNTKPSIIGRFSSEALKRVVASRQASAGILPSAIV